MFDIGFPELLIVSIVALLVLGPERLPEALRTLGLWFGRMRRSFSAVKVEIEREIGMDEVRRQLHNEAILEEMRALEADVGKAGNTLQNDLHDEANALSDAFPGNGSSDKDTADGTADDTPDALDDEGWDEEIINEPHPDDRQDHRASDDTPTASEDPGAPPTTREPTSSDTGEAKR